MSVVEWSLILGLVIALLSIPMALRYLALRQSVSRFIIETAEAAAIYGWNSEMLDRFRVNCAEVATELPVSAEEIATNLIAECGYSAYVLSVDEMRHLIGLSLALYPNRAVVD